MQYGFEGNRFMQYGCSVRITFGTVDDGNPRHMPCCRVQEASLAATEHRNLCLVQSCVV